MLVTLVFCSQHQHAEDLATYRLIVRRMQARDSGTYRCSVQSRGDTVDDFKDGEITVLGEFASYMLLHPSGACMYLLCLSFSASIDLAAQHNHLHDDPRGRQRAVVVLRNRKPSPQHHVGPTQRHDHSWQRWQVLSHGACFDSS